VQSPLLLLRPHTAPRSTSEERQHRGGPSCPNLSQFRRLCARRSTCALGCVPRGSVGAPARRLRRRWPPMASRPGGPARCPGLGAHRAGRGSCSCLKAVRLVLYVLVLGLKTLNRRFVDTCQCDFWFKKHISKPKVSRSMARGPAAAAALAVCAALAVLASHKDVWRAGMLPPSLACILVLPG
jgi:hypothetical protein